MSIITKEHLYQLSLNVFNLVKNDTDCLMPMEKTKFNFNYKVIGRDFSLKLAEQLIDKTELDEQMKLNQMLTSNIDLVPNQYEGGFKIWECSFDLIKYLQESAFLATNISLYHNMPNRKFSILDVGCGSGLLSIFLAKQMRIKYPNISIRIYLQDYNEHVIKLFTIPTILFNELPSSSFESLDEFKKNFQEIIEPSYNFMFGDWQLVRKSFLSKNIQFDLIVTSETIYDERNYLSLLDLFTSCLRQPNAQILIGSKSHYFGIGGGTHYFLDYLEEEYPLRRGKRPKIPKLEAEIADEIDDNLLRHIIQLKWSFDNDPQCIE